jgi:hypothetical protein
MNQQDCPEFSLLRIRLSSDSSDSKSDLQLGGVDELAGTMSIELCAGGK